jgi:CSLREA domain-containing protein
MASSSRAGAARILVPVVLLALGALAGCGDDGTAPEPVTVSISPTTATVGAAETQTLTATVSNATDTGVDWTASDGTIAGAGTTVTWTAPVAGGAYTVTATSTEDPSASATATLTVTAVELSVSAASTELLRDEPTTLQATLSGTGASEAVTWAVTCGTVTVDGLQADYRAPMDAGTCEITVTSDLDPSASASTSVTVRAASAVTTEDDEDDGTCTWDHCSLREAINVANATTGLDTVFLSTAAASATGSVAATARLPLAIQAAGALPTISDDLVVVGEGPELTEIDMQGNGRAFDVSGEAGPVALDLEGLTVRNAVADGGPALYVRDGAMVRGTDLALRDNDAEGGEGGAMVVVGEGTSAVLENVVFDGNETVTAGLPGGAVGIVNGASFEMTGGAFMNNRTSAWGGAVRGLNAERIAFDGTRFEGNAVLEGGFGGGALFLENPDGASGVVELTGVEIVGNAAPSSGGNGGGGMYLRAGLVVTITNSTIEGNDGGPDGWGGGLHMGSSEVRIQESSISGNSAKLGGGLFINGADVTLEGTSVEDNEGLDRAGGVFVGGTSFLTTTGGTVSGNTAGVGGGGLHAQDVPTLDLEGTVFAGNRVTGSAAGGGLAVFGDVELVATDVEIRDNEAAAAAGLFYLGNAGSSVELRQSLVDGNRAVGEDFPGGGIFADGQGTKITIIGSTLSNNTADGSGGGLFAQLFTEVEVTDSFILDNQAAISGAGLWLRGPSRVERTLVRRNTAGFNGGGISGGSGTEVMASTFHENSAGRRGGGAFFVRPEGSTPRMVNSTLSGNTAEYGGGITTLGIAELVHVTIVGNSATSGGGGAWIYSTDDASIVGELRATNTVFQGNAGPAGVASCAIDDETGGSATSGGGNVNDDESCGFESGTDQAGVEPGLDPELGDNGGPTPTHALQAGSPAIDAGVDAGITTDQTGAARSDGAPDAGAVEAGS